MPNDIDKSLLERLQALRGVSSPPLTGEQTAASTEKAKPTDREDSLTARLKSLRLQYGASSSSIASSTLKASKSEPQTDRANIANWRKSSSEAEDGETVTRHGNPEEPGTHNEDVDVEAILQTDIATLEEMLGQVGGGDTMPDEPSDEQIRTLLDEISQSIPPDATFGDRHSNGEKDDEDVDGDSEDEDHMNREADQVIARFRDKLELEATTGDDGHSENDDDDENGGHEKPGPDQLVLPSLPSNLDDLASTTKTTSTTFTTTTRATGADINDITARMASLRAPSTSTDLPSVPDSKPSSARPINRLTSKPNYTDDDMDSWCTVCLEDATLQCPACDDDVYCTRCWREMHVGPAAAFDERSHKAVIFTKSKKKKKVAVGVS